ncbi:MAG TPA: acyltransferase [Acidimicrobiales bacterium]|nr:acyltransferase [Acidimicrobiales bacterium]
MTLAGAGAGLGAEERLGQPWLDDADAPISGPPAERVWFAQALRGVACLIVVWEHLAHVYLTSPAVVRLVIFTPPDPRLGVAPPRAQTAVYEWMTKIHVVPGQFGVSLFFLISGFVIPFSLERHRLGGFFVRRFFRLYPTLWAAIGVSLTALAVQAFLVHNGFPVGKKSIATSGLLVGVYAGQPWVDPVYWTLAIEELFYAIVAIVAWRRLLSRPAVLAGVTLVLAVTAVALARMPAPTTFVPHFWYLRTHLARNSCFVIFILVGVAFHQHYRGRWSGPAAVAMGGALLATFAVGLLAGPFPGNQTGLYLGSAVAALLVFTPLYVLRDRVPYVGVLDALADISYPLYLIHTVLGWILLRALLHVFPNFFVAVPLTLAVCIAVATVVHRLVELPSNALGRRIVARPAFRRAP